MNKTHRATLSIVVLELTASAAARWYYGRKILRLRQDAAAAEKAFFAHATQAVNLVADAAERDDLDAYLDAQGLRVQLVRTSDACPEQYSLMFAGEEEAYLRLRHGRFTVQVPGPAGEVVFDAEFPADPDKGTFSSEQERQTYLAMALAAVASRLGVDFVLEDVPIV